MERTLVLVKPDGVRRKLVGEVVLRFERVGFKIVGLKMLKPTKQQVEAFYPTNDEWFARVGERSKKTFKEMGLDIKGKFGTEEAVVIGKTIKSWIVRFMTSGKIVAIVFEGNMAAENGRKLAGETNPIKALAGSIRGDFSLDSVALGNMTNRPIVNVLHASESAAEAKREIDVWFKESELVSYKRDDEDTFYKEW